MSDYSIDFWDSAERLIVIKRESAHKIGYLIELHPHGIHQWLELAKSLNP